MPCRPPIEAEPLFPTVERLGVGDVQKPPAIDWLLPEAVDDRRELGEAAA
jgi:hypothetical protein